MPIIFSKAIHISGIDVFDYDEPISNKSERSQAPKKTLLGWVEVVLSPHSMLQQQNEILENSILIILFGLVVGIILALRMEGKVTKPILRLTALVNSIEQGKYNVTVEHNSSIVGLTTEELSADRWNELYKQIRVRYSGPMLILTGDGQNEYLKDTVVSEKVLCETKPIRKNTLYKNICILLDINLAEGAVSTKKIVESKYRTNEIVVLVVEDNEFNQMLIREWLVTNNCNPIIVNSAAQAIETVRSQSIDLILMDIHLPDMSGIEASRIITENKNSTERPIIIALTADVFIDDRELLKKAGIDDCILKPIREDIFWSVINTWIADSETSRLPHTKTAQTGVTRTLESNSVLSDKLHREMDRLLTLIEYDLKCRNKEKLSKSIHE